MELALPCVRGHFIPMVALRGWNETASLSWQKQLRTAVVSHLAEAAIHSSYWKSRGPNSSFMLCGHLSAVYTVPPGLVYDSFQ